jgi:hypothetical protein
LSVAGVFGLFGGFSELGTGVIKIINQLLVYPFCDGTERKSQQIAKLEKARLQYHETFAETCKRLLTNEDVIVKESNLTASTPMP